MRSSYCILLCIVLLFACRNSEKERRVNDVRSWIGRKIEFPAEGIFTRFGKDTILRLPHTPFIIVNYIDSTGCVECRLRTLEWKNLMNKLERQYPGMVSLLFYVQAKDPIELMWILKGDDFGYPVCMDKDGVFGKINQLPLDVAFGTFLLNNNDEVQLVGNPIGNPSLEELYIEILEHHKNN